MSDLKNIPFYSLELHDEDDGIQYVALVDKPAIQKNWVALASQEHKFKAADIEKRVVTGPLLISNLPIYRNEPEVGEFYAVFSAESIEKTVQRFFKKGHTSNVNLMHEGDLQVKDIYMFESYLINRSRGINPPIGYEDSPDGSWFVSFKVDNQVVWDEFIKTGEFKGFSIEGVFKHKAYTKEQKLEQQIVDLISSISSD